MNWLMKLGFMYGALSHLVGCLSNEDGAAFEFIVVGGGTGGGTLAVELAKKGHRTLLIEAGPEHTSDIITTPALNAVASEDPNISFGFDVKHSEAEGAPTYFYPRVGALGGCSLHNAMISILPNLRDFNLMANLTNDPKFMEPNMRKYFKKMERNLYSTGLLNNTDSHGFNGWYPTSYFDLIRNFSLDPQLLNLLSLTVGNLWFDVNSYNTKTGIPNTEREGRLFPPMAVDRTRFERVNFLNHINLAKEKYNLTMWTDTFVTKLLFDEAESVEPTVKGVEFMRGKYLYRASPKAQKNTAPSLPLGKVFATKEVIVSGGAFNTPQILQLSGIGPKDELARHGIPVRADLPGVGRNLMDRYVVPVVIEFPKNFSIINNCKFIADRKLDPCYELYRAHQTGPYTSNGVFSGALMRSEKTLPEPDLFLINSLSNFHGYFRGYSTDITAYKNRFSQIILKAHTNNKGYVKLATNDPLDVPDINFMSFSELNGAEKDLRAIIKAVRHTRSNLKKLKTTYNEIYPGPSKKSDEQLTKFIKDIAWGHHACGTAKIGRDSDPDAVLDGKFKVRKVKSLRVVDASVLPEIPGYFPVVYIHMLAMRAASIIHKDYS